MIQEQRAELGSLAYPSLQILNEGSRMQSRFWEKTNQPPAVYLLNAASLKVEGLCSGASQVKSALRRPCIQLRCWSLHMHWLLAEGNVSSQFRKGPGSRWSGVGWGWGGAGQIQEHYHEPASCFSTRVVLCLYNEHTAFSKKSNSGPLGWKSRALERREGG